jgi:putative transposase
VCAAFETELSEFNGESSHVHLLVNFPPQGRPAEAGQLAERGLLAADAAGIPRPAPPLLEGEPPVVGVVLRRVRRGRPISVLRHYTERQDHRGGEALVAGSLGAVQVVGSLPNYKDFVRIYRTPCCIFCVSSQDIDASAYLGAEYA